MLLDDIIAILSDSKGSLTDALLKTKVLLHQIGKKELATWVTNELSGYPDDQPGTVPPYRVVGMQVHGHVTNMAWQMSDYILPILHLPRTRQQQLTECQFTESIASIEEMTKKPGQLRRPLPAEFGATIKKVLTPGTHVVSAWCELNMIQVENILTQVRSRLLDFMLELKGAVGDVAEKELPEKAQAVHAEKLFTTAIYNTGSGTVVLGSTNVQVNNKQGDIDGLLAEVKKLGFEKEELEELRQAVIEDKSKNEKPSITEGETSKWYMKALKKIGKGTLDVGVDVLSKVISESLKNYGG
jgi:AbiTii